MPDENAVESLMDQMHTALISADFIKLAEISPALEAALEDLPQSNDQTLIARLNKKATRNAATTFAEFPLVVIATKTSPACPNPSTCLEKICSKP